jgi:hypothetical protein
MVPPPPEVASVGGIWEMSLELSYRSKDLPVGVTALSAIRPD